MRSEGLRRLEELANQEKRKKCPNVPEHAIPKAKYSDANTNDLQSCIVDYIDLIGGWATRINTQGQYVEKLGRFIPGQTKRGTTDVIGLLPNGKFIGIECKQPGEKLRTEQQEVANNIMRSGGVHIVATVGNFQEVYKTINYELNKEMVPGRVEESMSRRVSNISLS